MGKAIALFVGATALACTGQIGDGSEDEGLPPQAGEKVASTGPYEFTCPSPSAGEPRPLRRLSRAELREHLVNVLGGTSVQSTAGAKIDGLLVALPEDAADASHYAEELLETSEGHVESFIRLAEGLQALVTGLPATDHALLSSGKCAAPLAMDTCARGIADELGLRLFRRPFDDAHIVKLQSRLTATGAATPAEAVGNAVSYLFLLPPSLLHLEDQGQVVGESVKITPFETMNRVHFGLLGAPPSVALLKTIRAGNWSRQKAEQRIDEILASTAFKTRVRTFFETWLDFGPNVDLAPLPAKMTTGLVLKELPAEAYEELRAFVTATVFTTGGNVADLFLSNKVHYLGPNLAKVYGLAPTTRGPLPSPALLDTQRYAGLLSRVSMNLQGDSQTRPISRGVRVKRKLLCEDIHPPANVNLQGGETVAIDDPNRYSNRFLVENKTRPAFCQACHVSIDRIGFSLDFYDSLGRYRTDEIRYDLKGNVANTFPLSEDASVPGPVALAREIVSSDKGSACLVSQWQSFTAQADKYSGESCLRRSLHEKVRAGGGGILEMIRQSARAEIEAVRAR